MNFLAVTKQRLFMMNKDFVTDSTIFLQESPTKDSKKK